MSASPHDLFTDPASYPHGAELLVQLLRSLERSRHAANFACGGVVSLSSSDEAPDSDVEGSPGPCAPPVIRWDSQIESPGSSSGVDGKVRKAVFPSSSSNENAISALVADCQPATFGLGQQDVLDESYRKAGKLDPSLFSTNFCPYETGIVDAVTTVLLNDTVGGEHVSLGVRAELYKLNVYSGPSGRFKAHVDTPRSEKQFGSLVVCLPYPHNGGALEVRHEGQVMKFDWSTDSDHADDIQWAAFYSDCEHEVMEVTAGHRITLTYNLYHKLTLTISPPISLPLDAKQTPFYKTMQKMIAMPEFLKYGGLLGIYCSHSYPHTHPLHYNKIPHMLKGADAAIYRSLAIIPGITVQLLPVLQKGANDDMLYSYEANLWEKEREAIGAMPQTLNSDDDDTDNFVDPRAYKGPDRSGKTLRKKVLGIESPPPETYQQYKERVGESAVSANRFRWLNRVPYTVKSPFDLAGAKLQPWMENDGLECESLQNFQKGIDKVFPLQTLRDVQWLNEQHTKELSMTYLAYGNQASAGYVYSHLSFIVSIPPYQKRQLPTTE